MSCNSASSIHLYTADRHHGNQEVWESLFVSKRQLDFCASTPAHVTVYVSKTMASVHPSWLAAKAFCHLLFRPAACTAALASTLSETRVPFSASTPYLVNKDYLGHAGLQGDFQWETLQVSNCCSFPALVVMSELQR